ncbi:hypothetical protein, conserved [Plasmodium gonderi]|uniref:Uncharacterized protein n=1 Tax=Plasmodium gonderi TaxID=77519 RepID=A0A1Y1JM09_PLAGO|nr:hypothetical protein, conserved [Plasmodium gonderi]GAW83626.1 hypothetical protein, conserved [Plasmodium gonderi]
MLSHARKIKYIKNILYREKEKKKKKGRVKWHSQHIPYTDKYREKVTFLYKKKTLIQIIEHVQKEKALYLFNKDTGTCRTKNEIQFMQDERKHNHLREPTEADSKWMNFTQQDGIFGEKNRYHGKDYMSSSLSNIKNGEVYSKKIVSDTVIDEKYQSTAFLPLCRRQEDSQINLDKKKKKKKLIMIKKYEDMQEKNENRQNKIVIKYQMETMKHLIIILKKCEEYNYANYDLYGDICRIIPFLSKNGKNVKHIVTILHSLIKLNYFNEKYFIYPFWCIMNEDVFSNSELISILLVLSNLEKLNTLNYLFFYKVNYMLLHRIYSLSLHQIYNVLNAYLKVHKRLAASVDHGRKYKNNLTDQLRDDHVAIFPFNRKINSQNFKLFYNLSFHENSEKSTQSGYTPTTINFVFRLIDCLKKKKISIKKADKFINPHDCFNEFFIQHIKKELGHFFLKKLKSEYILFNRLERKNLYKIRDTIWGSLKGNQTKGQNGFTHFYFHRKDNNLDGLNLNEEVLNSPPVPTNNGARSITPKLLKLKKFEYIQLKLIKKMKKQLDARLLIPLIKVYQVGAQHNSNSTSSQIQWKNAEGVEKREKDLLLHNASLKDFFINNYKHMPLKFNEKSLVITLSCFSKQRKILSDEVLGMLINMIEKKINRFTHGQIVDIMNSISNIRNGRISINVLNFLIRFLFNNNKIIYMNDAHINTLLNVLIKKKQLINEDAILFITNFVVNHKPYFKNLKNMYSYFSFHFHFKTLNEDFLNTLYCSFLSNKNHNNIQFEQVNQILSSTLVISNHLKYQKRVFKQIDMCLLSILKKMNPSCDDNFIHFRDLDNLVQCISHINNSITSEVYKMDQVDIHKIINGGSHYHNAINFVYKRRHYKNGHLQRNNYTKNLRKKKNEEKKKKLQFYYSHNSYKKIYYMISSFNLRIFILIKKIFEKFLKQQNCIDIHNEGVVLLIKAVTNLYELQKKTMKVNKIYTYFYITKKWKCRKNKLLNAYFLKIINQINKNILQFLSTLNKEIIFLCNVHMLKSSYLFEPLNNDQVILSYLQKRVCQMEKKRVSISNAVFFLNFLSSYKIDEMVLQNDSAHLKQSLRSPNDTRIGLEEIGRRIIQSFLASQKMENPEEKREKLFDHIYNEKKRKKSNIKNVIQHFFLTYKHTNLDYFKKHQHKKKVYINKIWNNLERKMLKRKIKKMDDLVKKNINFMNLNKYNKFFISKFVKKWKKKKKYLILKCITNSSYVDTNDLIELLFSTIVTYLRCLINHQKNSDNNPPVNEYQKCITFVLNKMIVLKKPKIANTNYSLYFKLLLCIATLKCIFPKLLKNYNHILMYWKKIIGANLGNEKTFKNYFDYVKSGSVGDIREFNHLDIPHIPTLLRENMNSNLKNCNFVKCTISNEKTKRNLTHHPSCTFQQFLNYPSISQTKYKYKLKNKKHYSFNDCLYFKNAKYYKNVVFHNIYEHFSYLQNYSHILYLHFLYLKKRIQQMQSGKMGKLKKKKKKFFKNATRLNCTKRSSILFKNSIHIIEVKKVEFFHNHLIKVDICKKNNINSIRTFFFLPYSTFNLNTEVKNVICEKNQMKSSEHPFLKRELFLTLFLMNVEFRKHIQTEFNIVPMATDQFSSIHTKHNLHLYLVTKLLR